MSDIQENSLSLLERPWQQTASFIAFGISHIPEVCGFCHPLWPNPVLHLWVFFSVHHTQHELHIQPSVWMHGYLLILTLLPSVTT